MGDRNFKEIRKQLRNVVREILPEVLGTEAVSVINKRIDTRLDGISGHMSKTLQDIDQRSRDVQAFVIRHIGTGAVRPAAESSEGQSK